MYYRGHRLPLPCTVTIPHATNEERDGEGEGEGEEREGEQKRTVKDGGDGILSAYYHELLTTLVLQPLMVSARRNRMREKRREINYVSIGRERGGNEKVGGILFSFDPLTSIF